jgi:peptide/nickel transport system substrate-binding protein
MIVETAPSAWWEHLTFNLDRPYFQDKTVRQAIAYAIDRKKIADVVSLGTWTVLNTLVPPAMWSSVDNSNFPEEWKAKFPPHIYPYDPAKANQMLDQAGWVRGPDGIRAKSGVRLSFRYDTTSNSAGGVRDTTQAMVKSDLQAVGIEAKTAQAPSGDFFDALGTRDFDMAEFAWLINWPVGSTLYTSTDVPTIENGYNGQNVGDYRNPHWDQLASEADTEVGMAAQYPIQAELQAIYTEDLPSLPLYVRNDIEVHTPSLMNWKAWDDRGVLDMAPAMYFK